MNLEYELTIEHDLDSQATDWEIILESKLLFLPYRYFPHFLCVMSIGFIVWGFFEPVKSDQYLLFGTGCFGLIIGIVLLVFWEKSGQPSSLKRKDLQKRFGDYYEQKSKRQITLTEQELIFKTSDAEIAWSWQALKSLKEGSNGFRLDFFSGHTRFVPKRAFVDQQQIDDFQHLIKQYQSETASNVQ
ncbi:MAG: YcxB family protein [Waterburya sp.]